MIKTEGYFLLAYPENIPGLKIPKNLIAGTIKSEITDHPRWGSRKSEHKATSLLKLGKVRLLHGQVPDRAAKSM